MQLVLKMLSRWATLLLPWLTLTKVYTCNSTGVDATSLLKGLLKLTTVERKIKGGPGNPVLTISCTLYNQQNYEFAHLIAHLRRLRP